MLVSPRRHGRLAVGPACSLHDSKLNAEEYFETLSQYETSATPLSGLPGVVFESPNVSSYLIRSTILDSEATILVHSPWSSSIITTTRSPAQSIARNAYALAAPSASL